MLLQFNNLSPSSALLATNECPLPCLSHGNGIYLNVRSASRILFSSMHFPPHFKYYLYYALELVLAACSMIALLAVTAGLNCVFNFALAHNWITLKFAKPIFNAIEYYLIIMSVIAFFEMSRASTRILRFELKRFYLKSDEGEGTVGKDAQAKDGRKEGGQ